VLPDGCMDLMWSEGTLIVAGPDTTASVSETSSPYVGLRFAAGDAPAVLGVPGVELRDQRVPLADLWPAPMVRHLTAQVGSAPSIGAALEEIALSRIAPPDPAVTGIVSLLESGASVVETAAAVEMGERRLHRRCLDAFGYGPKTLARILRLQRALALARSGLGFATVAADAGYADQAHLSRDVKALAGVTLGALVGDAELVG
jgi:AraC-like DNA-binding protein